MTYTNLMFSDEARLRCMKGIGAVADAAKVTFGPKGRTVMMDMAARQPRSTSQAAMVMRDFRLENPFENFGAELVRHAALETHAQAGDGATTCILLTQAIARGGVKAVATGHDAVCVARGIKEAIAMVDLYLHALSRPVVSLDQLVGVALSASHGDARMAKAIATAAWHAEREAPSVPYSRDDDELGWARAEEENERALATSRAVEAALSGGIVAGGGAALFHARTVLMQSSRLSESELRGVDAVHEALAEPLQQIADNAGHSGSFIASKLEASEHHALGFDACKGQIVNMFDTGIVDPVPTVRAALRCAGSIAGLLTNAEALLAHSTTQSH